MTDEDIRRHIELMRAIDKPTVHLPLETVERLMSTGHRVKIGKASVKGGKFKPVSAMPLHRKIAATKKADRTETRLRANRKGKA